MQALPLFLDRLADPITAVVVSVTVVLIFGEPPYIVASCFWFGMCAHLQSPQYRRDGMQL